MPYNLTKKQLENLQLLHDGLPKQKNLEMKYYAENAEGAKTATKEHPCGTTTCIAGFGPSCGVPIKPNEFWFEYTERQFHNENDGRVDDFIFYPDWPNSIEQGQKRIKMVIDGKMPENFDFKDRY